jgi:hypothetical protein
LGQKRTHAVQPGRAAYSFARYQYYMRFHGIA